MQKIVFFFIKKRFFCKKYLVYKDFLVTLRSYSELGNNRLSVLREKRNQLFILINN